MTKTLFLVTVMLAVLAFCLAGCDEETEEGDADTDSVMDTEPEPYTEMPLDPEDDGHPVGGHSQSPHQAKASRGF